ncbi:MFS transporter [Sodalis sp. RH21]|uniref:MFS transporter n=1 Tax=unclassified Sodalis (in: enterobacteria) TaxID=2636512 RepID=UPI0039B4E074
MNITQQPRPAKLKPSDLKAIAASAIGNCIELFDLTVFGFFAAVIGAQFFPNDNPVTSTLSSFATFAIGFLMRPAGALLLAPIGDKFGRKQLLSITMILMGLASLGIALLPGYAIIGWPAPVLLILFRLMQGFAAGGEWGGAVSMMVEHAPADKRGFIGSFQQVGFGLGILAGTICSFLLNTYLSHEQVAGWGWRIPFFIGSVVTPLALYIRRNIEESPEFVAFERQGELPARPLTEVFRYHYRGILCVIGIGTVGTAAGYIANQFMNNYASGTLGMPMARVSLLIMVASVLQTLLIPVWGWVSDKVGRVQVIGGAALLYLILIYPLFVLLSQHPSAFTLGLLVISCAILVSASFGPLPALISEFFPAHIRTTAISIGYNFAAALFGGCAPLISTWLISRTGNLISPTYYAIFCALISTITAAVLFNQSRKLSATNKAA